MTDVMGICLLNSHATVPTYGSEGAAGMDLYANTRSEGFGMVNIEPGERRLIKTGVSIALPAGTYGRVAPRSGLAYKHGIDVMAGVIDEDYRGDVGAILVNLGEAPFVVTHGDRIAQLIVEIARRCTLVVRESLTTSDRADGGFGSTGTR